MTETALTIQPKPRKRPNRVSVRFTNEEYEHVRGQAEIVDRNPASLLRALSMGQELRPVPRFPPDVQRAIKSLGGNLNQLAHQANVGRVDKSQVEALRAEVETLLQALRTQPCPS